MSGSPAARCRAHDYYGRAWHRNRFKTGARKIVLKIIIVREWIVP